MPGLLEDHGYRAATPGFQEYAESARRDVGPWMAMAGSMLPGIGDVVGLLSDYTEFKEQPSILGGAAMAAGALPFIPSGLGMVHGLKGATVSERTALNDAIQTYGSDSPEVAELGWWKGGVDNKWKKEFSDADSAVIDLPKKLNLSWFEEVLLHPELFERYPQLGEIITEIEPGSKRGQFNHRAQELSFSAPNEQILHSGLLHEGQHAIQGEEGFTSGANFNAAKKNSFPKLQQKKLSMLLHTPHLNKKRERVVELRAQGLIEASEKLREQLQLDVARMIYSNTAGEVEARAVQKRMGGATTPFVNDMDVPYSRQHDFKALLR